MLATLLDGARVRAVRGVLQLIERVTEKAPTTLYGPIMISTGLLQTLIQMTIQTQVLYIIVCVDAIYSLF
jgi:hypothetical protein